MANEEITCKPGRYRVPASEGGAESPVGFKGLSPELCPHFDLGPWYSGGI